jgi:hypothetical protein
MARPIRILGIDPGLRRTGWGMVAIDGNRLSFLACGSVATDDKAALACGPRHPTACAASRPSMPRTRRRWSDLRQQGRGGDAEAGQACDRDAGAGVSARSPNTRPTW